jgi:hypothetical protein
MRATRLLLCLVSSILLLLLLPAGACSSSSETTGPGSSSPISLTSNATTLPITLEKAPEEAVALDLWKAFKADEGAAQLQYEGKSLHFARVRVDKMSFLGEGADQELYVQEGIEPAVELVKFRTDLVNDIISVRETYIVEIVGKVQGMQFGYLIIRISWLKVIDPPGGDTKPPAEY